MVAHRNTVNTQVTSASTALTVTMPTHVAGDLVCVDFAVSTPSAAQTMSATGWNVHKDQFISAASNAGGHSLSRIAPVGGLGSTVVFTCSQSVGFNACASSYQDPDPTTPISIVGTTNNGNSSSPQANAVNVPNDGSILRYVQANDDDDNGTMPSGMTSRHDAGVATPSNGRWLVVSDLAVDSGDTGTKTGSIAASEEWAAWMYAINPILTSFEFSGTTRNEGGTAEGSCDVYAIEEPVGDLVDSYAISDGNINMDGERGVGQSFPGNGGVLSYASFELSKLGTPTGDVTAVLYAHSGTYGTSSVPTGAALATSAAIDASTLTATPTDYLFDFSEQPYTLASGTNYVIALLHASGDATDNVRPRRDDTTTSHGGNYSEYNGTTWSVDATRDLVFAVYTGHPVPAGHVVSNVTTGAYTHAGLPDATEHIAVAFKDGTPDLMDVTDPITPTEI